MTDAEVLQWLVIHGMLDTFRLVGSDAPGNALVWKRVTELLEAGEQR